MYLGGADPRDPRASPLHADLRGLPPVLAQAGTVELLLGEVTALAERLRAAGGQAELSLYDDMVHGFQMMAPVFPVQSRRALDEVAAFVSARTQGAQR
jgi:acetyl esterase/lipase